MEPPTPPKPPARGPTWGEALAVGLAATAAAWLVHRVLPRLASDLPGWLFFVAEVVVLTAVAFTITLLAGKLRGWPA